MHGDCSIINVVRFKLLYTVLIRESSDMEATILMQYVTHWNVSKSACRMDDLRDRGVLVLSFH